MNLEALAKAMAELQDVTAADIADLAASSDPGVRRAARLAHASSAIRRALQYCADLAREQDYTDQGTLSAIRLLAGLSDWDEPYVETVKQLGLQAAGRHLLEPAMSYFQEAVFRGFSSGQKRNARSRASMRYALDPEIDAAIERLAGNFASPPFRAPGRPLRLTGLCSALADEDGPSVVTAKQIELFKKEGFDVELVSTETGSSAGSRKAAHVQSLGIPFTAVPGGSWEERVRRLIGHFTDRQTDVLVFMTSAQDCLARLLSCIRLAPVQVWDVRALEPQIGAFELVHNGIAPEQEVKTRWPGISRYTHPAVVMADEIDAAVPFTREDLALPHDAMLLGTFGRVEKANTDVYLEATATILEHHANAHLLFAGPDSADAMAEMGAFYTGRGVQERVHYLGRRQSDGPRLVKTIDVYCDTHPWPGGQSLLDAMQAGTPIVAMTRAFDPYLDPTGTGATTSVADVLLTGLVPIAPAGDVSDYVRIADAYLADAALRAADGAKLHGKAVNECGIRHQTHLYAQFIREAVAKKWGF